MGFEFGRFLKFAVVGGTGVVVNLGLLWLLTEITGLFYMFSAVISIEASIISNFLLNEHWTFSDRRQKQISMFRRGVKFNIVSVAGMLINITVLYLFTEFLGIYYIYSEIIGIAAAFLWNYFVNLYWTWSS